MTDASIWLSQVAPDEGSELVGTMPASGDDTLAVDAVIVRAAGQRGTDLRLKLQAGQLADMARGLSARTSGFAVGRAGDRCLSFYAGFVLDDSPLTALDPVKLLGRIDGQIQPAIAPAPQGAAWLGWPRAAATPPANLLRLVCPGLDAPRFDAAVARLGARWHCLRRCVLQVGGAAMDCVIADAEDPAALLAAEALADLGAPVAAAWFEFDVPGFRGTWAEPGRTPEHFDASGTDALCGLWQDAMVTLGGCAGEVRWDVLLP